MKDDLLLGIDLGTGGCKISVLNCAGGLEASHSEDYATCHPQPGWAEQDPGSWYPALISCLKRLWTDGRVPPARIAALALDGSTHNAVLLDASMRPLRSVIMWTDQRSAAEAASLDREYGSEIFRISYQRPTATWTLSQLLWLKKHEPELVDRVAQILFVKDYVRYLVTGVACTDFTEAQGTLFFDMSRRCWSQELYALTGFPYSALPAIVRPTEIVGRVTQQAARDTGLLAGTPVVCGTTDSAVEAYAAGAIDPGQCVAKLATAGNFNVMTAEATPHPQTLTYMHVMPGLWYTVTATNAAAVCLRWFRNNFIERNNDEGTNQGQSVYRRMGEEAARSPAGARGLFFHPYLQGERSPYWDSSLRASFTGIGMFHGRSDFVRAVMEGVAFSLRDCRRTIEVMNLPTHDIRLIGGGAKDPLWAQIVCDVMNTPVVLPVHSDASSGAAMLAGVGIGLFTSERHAVDQCVRPKAKLSPHDADAEIYSRLFMKYRQIHDVLANIYHDAHDQTEKK
jgi:xylulokinase